jgi:hypothetical protein
LYDFQIPVLSAALGSARSVAIARDQILRAVKMACRHVRGGITPLVVDSINMELCHTTADDWEQPSLDASEDADR